MTAPLKIPTRESPIPSIKSFIPFQAFFQSPVKTPTRKSTTPPRDLIIPFATSLITPSAVPITSPINEKMFENVGPNFSTNQFIIGMMNLLNISKAPSTNFPINFVISSTSPLRCLSQSQLSVSNMFETNGSRKFFQRLSQSFLILSKAPLIPSTIFFPHSSHHL
ncbi:hypothetical protein D3C74_368650 [compost metagenome]